MRECVDGERVKRSAKRSVKSYERECDWGGRCEDTGRRRYKEKKWVVVVDNGSDVGVTYSTNHVKRTDA